MKYLILARVHSNEVSSVFLAGACKHISDERQTPTDSTTDVCDST